MTSDSEIEDRSSEIGRVIAEWFSLDSYDWNQRSKDKPRVSRLHDKDFFNFIWEHPEYEEYFDVVD